jgi:site-specific DNA-methyltransferase (adenine-specific)
MKQIPDGSVDMILCDLPYGTTACAWDSVLPFSNLWEEYNRFASDQAAFVFTSAQPFTTILINSNIENFKYCWYWNKKAVTGFANAKKQPLRCIEDVAVFYRKRGTYNPQGLLPFGKTVNKGKSAGGSTVQGDTIGNEKGSLRSGLDYTQEFTNYPRQLLEISRDNSKLHPTQKPVALMEYLIKTYTNEGDTVLDNCMGSGTTGVACKNLNRNFIGIEKDENYFEIAKRRIEGVSHSAKAAEFVTTTAETCVDARA